MAMMTVPKIQALKAQGEKIVCLTAYDATFARICSDSGVDCILVGDSLGSVVGGQDTTVPVTIEQVVYHTLNVARGNQQALVMADLPFMTYYNVDQALANAKQLMQAGAAMVKLEGGAYFAEVVRALVACGIPVCGHLGLTPQSVHAFGGHKVQGRADSAKQQLANDAIALQDAGASMLVLECIPFALANEVTAKLAIPTIGIGAGVDTDGQVLVYSDMLGMQAGKPLKFVKNFLAAFPGSIQDAVAGYVNEVKGEQFPGVEHCFG